jgi:hypothetical protein
MFLNNIGKATMPYNMSGQIKHHAFYVARANQTKQLMVIKE